MVNIEQTLYYHGEHTRMLKKKKLNKFLIGNSTNKYEAGFYKNRKTKTFHSLMQLSIFVVAVVVLVGFYG